MARRIFQQDVTVQAGADTPLVQLDNTIEQLPRKLIAVGTDTVTATIDLLVDIDDKRICDRPADTLHTEEPKQTFANDLVSGQRTLAGIRNGTAAAVTAALFAEYEVTE